MTSKKIDFPLFNCHIIFPGGGGSGSAGGPSGGGVRVFDVETSQELRPALQGHEDFVHSMDFCPATNALVSASEDGTARCDTLEIGAII